jgi:long-chain acyl-CoA synthetase
MSNHWLIERLLDREDRPALVWRDQTWSYAQLCDAVQSCRDQFERHGVRPASTLAICGDYSPKTCALLIAALANRNIVVPLASAALARRDELLRTAQVQAVVDVGGDETTRFCRLDHPVDHPLLQQLADRGAAGLVLFSSGSTGASKASLLDFEELLAKFKGSRPPLRTLAFLLIDHIGGINTLFHTLAHGGTLVTANDRSLDAICTAIAAHRIALLPTTPTFLRMLLIAEAHVRHKLDSLEIVTYGTEPMPASTLAAARAALPQVRFKQTYGLSELGILPTRSVSSDSLWIELGTEGFEHRIVDGMLWIRARSAMMGYLNAPSPFDPDGWFNTQDLVEVDGDRIRILGRKSEMINVGGEKVHPTEVENILLEFDNVKDVTVFGRSNSVTGQIVAARVTPVTREDPDLLKRRIRAFCQARLEKYKVPVFIEIAADDHHGARFKKLRDGAAGTRAGTAEAFPRGSA